MAGTYQCNLCEQLIKENIFLRELLEKRDSLLKQAVCALEESRASAQRDLIKVKELAAAIKAYKRGVNGKSI